jgi:hypothetical protein
MSPFDESEAELSLDVSEEDEDEDDDGSEDDCPDAPGPRSRSAPRNVSRTTARVRRWFGRPTERGP